MANDLEALARAIPSQGGGEIGGLLRAYAVQVKQGCIVEVGSWLGAGTAHLALGAMASGAPVHCFDRWEVARHEVAKLQRCGVDLDVGEDIFPLVREKLSPFPADIRFHRGNIMDARWDGGAIGLYVDDAAKVRPVWERAMSIFGPSFIPGETVMVLMDYHYDEKRGAPFRAQKRYMRSRPDAFECITDRVGESSTAVFRYLGGLW